MQTEEVSFWYKNTFLSNFEPCKIMYQGFEYFSVAHAYFAAKLESAADREIVQAAIDWFEAETLSRTYRVKPGWYSKNNRLKVMYDLLTIKFNTNKELKRKLLDTKDALIVSKSEHSDRYYGMCHCDMCEGCGLNIMGTLLMQVREEIIMSESIKLKNEN